MRNFVEKNWIIIRKNVAKFLNAWMVCKIWGNVCIILQMRRRQQSFIASFARECEIHSLPKTYLFGCLLDVSVTEIKKYAFKFFPFTNFTIFRITHTHTHVHHSNKYFNVFSTSRVEYIACSIIVVTSASLTFLQPKMSPFKNVIWKKDVSIFILNKNNNNNNAWNEIKINTKYKRIFQSNCHYHHYSHYHYYQF